MTKLALWILGLVLVAGSSGVGQVMIPDQKHPTKLGRNVYGLGLAAGATTGLGVSFRHHLASELSYQVVGGIIKVDTKLSFDLGLETQFDFLRGQETRFFGAGGLAYFYSGDKRNTLSAPFRAGIGVGGEFSNIQLVHITASAMFTFFSDGTILPLPQLGIHYYFF
jgi:hypothetical protein